MDQLQEKLYKLIHRGELTIDDIGDLFGVSVNSIYKMGEEDSSLVKAIRRTTSLMKLQKDYGIIEWMANRTGHLLVKVPRVGKDKRDDAEVVASYQQITSTAVSKMIEYFADPENEKLREELFQIMTRCAERSIAIRKRIEKRNQMDIFNEE
jgi:hypothetical protein